MAGEQLPTPKPLPGLTKKQRRSSLSNPKDEKGDLEIVRNSKTQTLPVKRDTEEVMFELAVKQGHPTWRGEIVSKSKFRRMKTPGEKTGSCKLNVSRSISSCHC